MKVIADLCVVPMGVGVSVSKYVTACENVLKAAGLKTKLHAYGTNNVTATVLVVIYSISLNIKGQCHGTVLYSEVQKYLYTFLWVYCVCSRAIHSASYIHSRVLKLPKCQIM